MNSDSIRPVITGIGLVTPLGTSAPTTWHALLAGRFITDHARVSPECQDHLPRVSHLAIAAAREAAVSTPAGSIDTATALVVGTSKGPVEEWLAPPARLPDEKGRICVGLAGTSQDIAEALKLTGLRLTISAACASGLHALIRGAMLIASGEVKCVLVVAAEASIHPLFIASFNRLGVLPSAAIGCRPFDRNRQGFLMGEAAAAVVLEGSDSMHRQPDRELNITPIIGRGGLTWESVEIDRFACGADATHLTAGDCNGTTLGRLLGDVLRDEPADLIHAHGTGTMMNDSTELATIERIIRETSMKPSLYSHKGALGHSLGAAGLVAVVINVLCHRNGIVPGNIRTSNPIEARKVTIAPEPVRRRIRRSVALAAGFGGPIAAIGLLSQPR
jgi:3-oxoacyl-[acyl-carrier-protein] synthase II